MAKGQEILGAMIAGAFWIGVVMFCKSVQRETDPFAQIKNLYQQKKINTYSYSEGLTNQSSHNYTNFYLIKDLDSLL